MRRTLAMLRSYWALVYWLAFACVAAIAARDPGYVLRSHPLPPFPWVGLAVIWTILAAETYGLHFFLHRGPKDKSALWQLTKASLYSLALSVFSIATFVTDQGVLFEMPMWFAFVSFVLFGALSLASGAARLWRLLS